MCCGNAISYSTRCSTTEAGVTCRLSLNGGDPVVIVCETYCCTCLVTNL